jgi:hypothetical protein
MILAILGEEMANAKSVITSEFVLDSKSECGPHCDT